MCGISDNAARRERRKRSIAAATADKERFANHSVVE
jgi:hypothetical protein